MSCPLLFYSKDALCVRLAFYQFPVVALFPPTSSFVVSIVSLDLIYCCICSFGPRSFFFPYQLFARWLVCESCLICSGVQSRAGQESSTGYSVNVCACLCFCGRQNQKHFLHRDCTIMPLCFFTLDPKKCWYNASPVVILHSILLFWKQKISGV